MRGEIRELMSGSGEKLPLALWVVNVLNLTAVTACIPGAI
jgi:hypothetical protein